MTGLRARVLALTIPLALAVALAPAGSGTVRTGRAGSPMAPGTFTWPIPGSSVISTFHAPTRPWGPGHRGLDVAATPGTAVVAPVSGTVTFAGRVGERPLVSIRPRDAGSTLITLEPVDSRTGPGQSVRAGEALGTVATGGHCDQRCLHIGVRSTTGYADPWPLFSRQRPVLKPP